MDLKNPKLAAPTANAHALIKAHHERRKKRARHHGKHHPSAESARDAAKRARDSAQHPPAPAPPPTPITASPITDVFSVSVSPNPASFGSDATLTIAMNERGVSAQIAGENFSVAVAGSVTVTAQLRISAPDIQQLFHDWHCTRKHHDDLCNNALDDFWHPCPKSRHVPPEPHDYHCARCGAGLPGWDDNIRDAVCQTNTLRPPEVTGGFPVSGSITIDVDAAAHRLFLSFEPQELASWTSGLGSAAASSYESALRDPAGAFHQLTHAFTSSLPDAARSTFDSVTSRGLDSVVATFTGDVTQAFAGLADALQKFATDQMSALNELFQKAVELLALLLDPRALIRIATNAICDALRAGSANALSLWNHASWLLGFCIRTNVDMAQWLVSQLVIAAKGDFEKHRDQIDVMLNDDLGALHDKGVDMLSFARGVLTTVRDKVGDVASSAKMLCDIAIAIVPTALANANDFASTLGSFAGLFLKSVGDDVGAILGPLGDRLADVHQLTSDEVKLLLSHLGDDGIFHKCAKWVYDNIARFGALVKEGLDELTKWLKFILDLIEKAGPAGVLPQYDRLVSVLKAVLGLPQALVAAPELANAQHSIDYVKDVFQHGGILPWLAFMSEQTGAKVNDFARDFISEKNAFVQLMTRFRSAILPILGQVEGDGAALVDAYVKAVNDLNDFERSLWADLFEGGLGEGPLTAFVSAHGLITDPVTISGGGIQASPPTGLTDAINKGEQVTAGAVTNVAPDTSFVQFDIHRERLLVPHPCDTGKVGMPSGATLLPFDPPVIPLSIPLPFDCSAAICHLPEFYVMDMRYHFPYGDVACYHAADQDNDGFVRDWEVRNVRAAVTQSKNDPTFYDFTLDCDGDGNITENDLQLAIEQQSRYVNGIMYRPTTSPLGLFVSPAPGVWLFNATTDLTEESIPRGVDRRGIVTVLDGQLIIPIPDLNYPLRFHLEQRICVDQLGGLVPGQPPMPMGFGPITETVRVDAILRGGKTGRDWQVYCLSEPMNPLLMSFNIRGNAYLRGVGSAGLAGGFGAGVSGGGGAKGAAFIHFSYEMSAPLVEVAEEWSDRLGDLAKINLADLPVPFKFIENIFEWTDVPRLCRGLIQICGPLVDLLFDWCDKGHHARAVLGYLRQYTLNHWEPAKTWAQVRQDVSSWQGITADERIALVGAVKEAQRDVQKRVSKAKRAGLKITRADDEDAVFVPGSIAKKCRDALKKLDATPAHEKHEKHAKHDEKKDHHAKHADAKDAHAKPDEKKDAKAPKDAKDHKAATALIKSYFEDARGTFAASLDQLVPEGDPSHDEHHLKHEPAAYASRVSIPLCGQFEVLNPFIAAFPVRYSDLKSARPNEATLDEILEVRGNPFYKPIYHTVVEFGPDAKLYSAPCADPTLFITSAAGGKGLVEGSRVLEDGHGNRWLWVRTESWQHGWLYIDADVVDAIFSVKEAAEVAGKDIAQEALRDILGEVQASAGVSVLDPDQINRGLDDLVAILDKKGQRPTVTRIEASARNTVDESRYARVCRAAKARTYVGRANGSDADVIRKYDQAVVEFKRRLLGVGNESMSVDDLAKAFNNLSVAKREKLWAAGTAWLKLLDYVPVIAKELLEDLVPPLLSGNFQDAWDAIVTCLKKCADVELDALLIAAQSCAPAVKEVVCTMVDIGIKLKKIRDMIMNMDPTKVAQSGTVPAAGGGDQDKVSWNEVGLKLVRLFIDDEEEPGRPPAKKKAAPRGLRKNHDTGISFSVEASVTKPKTPPTTQSGSTTSATMPPPSNTRTIALATPVISKVEDVIDGDGATSPDVGQVIEAQVTEWSALVVSEPPQFITVDTARIPEAFRKTVRWQVTNDDGQTWTDLPDDSASEDPKTTGEHLYYTVRDVDANTVVKFRAFTSSSAYAAYLASLPDVDPADGNPPDTMPARPSA